MFNSTEDINKRVSGSVNHSIYYFYLLNYSQSFPRFCISTALLQYRNQDLTLGCQYAPRLVPGMIFLKYLITTFPLILLFKNQVLVQGVINEEGALRTGPCLLLLSHSFTIPPLSPQP